MKYRNPFLRSPQRSHHTQDLKSALHQLYKNFEHNPQFQRAYIAHAWETTMGPSVAKRTAGVYLKRGTLFVKMESAPLKQELVFAKSRILELLNEYLGEKKISEIVFQ